MSLTISEKSFLDMSIGGEHAANINSILGSNVDLLGSMPGGVITLEQWNDHVQFAVQISVSRDPDNADTMSLFRTWMNLLPLFIDVGKVRIKETKRPKRLRTLPE